jgi:GTP-binding protein
MKFIDSTIVYVKAGDGGSGNVNFQAGKNKPKLGPDGGDGGFGGHVYFVGDDRLNTLSALRYKQWYRAEDGAKGGANRRTGYNGADCLIPVPLGTVAFNEATGDILCEVLHDGEQVLVCKGGKRGLGNARYLSSTNQAPIQFTKGGEGEEYSLRLELKLLADVGFAGFPNAGKSTLLSVMTNAKPKIADYPFTTLVPQLGVVELDRLTGGYGDSYVIADIPGLIEGAHLGKGLGHEFLKHLERTQLIVFLLNGADLLAELDLSLALEQLRFELKAYSPLLAAKPSMVVVNKADLFVDNDELLQAAVATIRTKEVGVAVISAATGQGIDELKLSIQRHLTQHGQRSMGQNPVARSDTDTQASALSSETPVPKRPWGKIINQGRSKAGGPDLIVFGGTFDPPHRGHLDCIHAALKKHPGARVLVVPAFSPPQVSLDSPRSAKPLEVKTPVLSYKQRLGLMELVLHAEFPAEQVELSQVESTMPTPSFTSMTLKAIAEKYPNKRLGLLIGEDQLEAFHRWKNPLEILSMADLLVVRRRQKLEGVIRFRDIRESIQTLLLELQLDAQWESGGQRLRLTKLSGSIELLDVNATPAESRVIRDLIAKGEKPPEGWMMEYLQSVLDQQDLYKQLEKK